MRVLDQRQSADAGTNDAADAGGQFIVQRLARGQTSVAHCLFGRRDTVMDERIHRARIFGTDEGVQVKTLDLASYLAGKVRRIELGDEVYAGFPGEDVGPGIGHRIANGGDATQAGHDNATTAHALNLC